MSEKKTVTADAPAAVTTRKPRTKSAPENETKEARFVRLANFRVNKLLKEIDNIGKLSGASYGYTPEQISKIFDAISNKAEEAYNKFSKDKKADKETFTL